MADGWQIVPGSPRGTEDLVGGKFIPVMEFQVSTVDGATNTFRIPTANYTPDAVRAEVQAWYERHRAIIDL